MFSLTFKNLSGALSVRTGLVACLLITLACYFNYFSSFSLWNTSGNFWSTTSWFTTLFSTFFFSGIFLIRKKAKPHNKQLPNYYTPVLILAPLFFALKITLPFDTLFRLTQLSFFQNTNNPANWLGGFIWIGGCMALLHYHYEGSFRLYWTRRPATRLFPYLFMVLFMVPFIAAAANTTEFLELYPRAKEVSHSHPSSTILLKYTTFELFYLFDFLSIELFFRGLLLAILSKKFGIYAILPSALFYFSIHLGKPLLEAVGSFFGGLILGTIAWQTKSVWGGWLVHIGIALAMELIAALI